jgi:hypothetical protein
LVLVGLKAEERKWGKGILFFVPRCCCCSSCFFCYSRLSSPISYTFHYFFFFFALYSLSCIHCSHFRLRFCFILPTFIPPFLFCLFACFTVFVLHLARHCRLVPFREFLGTTCLGKYAHSPTHILRYTGSLPVTPLPALCLLEGTRRCPYVCLLFIATIIGFA